MFSIIGVKGNERKLIDIAEIGSDLTRKLRLYRYVFASYTIFYEVAING